MRSSNAAMPAIAKADAKERINMALAHDDPAWGYHRIMCSGIDRQFMDQFLVAEKHPLAAQVGTNEWRFRQLHAAGHRFD